VLFSAVRTAAGGRIGFVADERRLNVGLTRARASLLVLGCARALGADDHWAALVRHCAAAGCALLPALSGKNRFASLHLALSSRQSARPPVPVPGLEQECCLIHAGHWAALGRAFAS